MSNLQDSILLSTKKLIGFDESYTVFDLDLMIHINTCFSTLTQLGVGPEDGFSITGPGEVWSDFLKGNKVIDSVKTYVYIKVKLVFDRPETGYAITSMENVAKEIEWRLNVQREEAKYVASQSD